jgi:hypothetical protein
LDESIIFLIPIGSDRFDLYTEVFEESVGGAEPAGFWRRKTHQLQERWREIVDAAQAAGGDRPRSSFARARDWMVRHVAESIAEQRTLWSLRRMTAALFMYPADLTETAAAVIRTGLLARARRHHGVWLLVNLAGAAGTAVLVLLPGPNVIGYYFLFRVVGHFLSWRGARRGLDHTTWRARPEPALAELGALAGLPREARHERVMEIGVRLQLPHLAAFFDRVAVGGR